MTANAMISWQELKVPSSRSCSWFVFSLSSQIAEMIRHVIDRYEEPIPAVLEIPSKDHPYDPTKDSILRRAKVYSCKMTYMLVFAWQAWNTHR